MKKFIDKLATPPGGFYYRQPESGFEFRHIVFVQLLRNLRDHRVANGYDVTPGWEVKVEDEMCDAYPAGICAHVDETASTDGRSITIGDVINFLKVLASWIGDKATFVPQEEADRRARICVDCPHNVKIANCSPCAKLAERVSALLGDRSTPYDDKLEACGICGCSNKAQVHFPLEVLHKGVSDEMSLKFPEWCWKRKI
jgi:hypothetical protein